MGRALLPREQVLPTILPLRGLELPPELAAAFRMAAAPSAVRGPALAESGRRGLEIPPSPALLPQPWDSRRPAASLLTLEMVLPAMVPDPYSAVHPALYFAPGSNSPVLTSPAFPGAVDTMPGPVLQTRPNLAIREKLSTDPAPGAATRPAGQLLAAFGPTFVIDRLFPSRFLLLLEFIGHASTDAANYT